LSCSCSRLLDEELEEPEQVDVDEDELVDVLVVLGGGLASAMKCVASMLPRPVTVSYPAPAL
jgi:hypothetical protein